MTKKIKVQKREKRDQKEKDSTPMRAVEVLTTASAEWRYLEGPGMYLGRTDDRLEVWDHSGDYQGPVLRAVYHGSRWLEARSVPVRAAEVSAPEPAA